MKFFLFILLAGLGLTRLQAQMDLTPRSPKLNYSFQTGTSFQYSPGMGNGNALYFAPEVNWTATPKLKVNAGVMFIHSRYNLQPQTGRIFNQSLIMNSPSGNMYTSRVSATGIYSINSKLTLTGSILSDFASPSSGYSSSNPLRMMSVEMNYKLSDKVNFGASVRMVQSEYQLSPYGFNNSSVLGNGFTNEYGY